MLANQGGLEPFFDQPLARPRDRVDTALQGRRDLAVAPALTTLRGVGFQQDPGLQQLLCWMVSAMDKGGEMLSLLIAQCHYVFLYRDLFPGHQSAPSAATEPSNQTNTADSMTGATSRLYGGPKQRIAPFSAASHRSHSADGRAGASKRSPARDLARYPAASGSEPGRVSRPPVNRFRPIYDWMPALLS